MVVAVVRHKKISGTPAGPNPNKVYGTHWDDDHAITGLESLDYALSYLGINPNYGFDVSQELGAALSTLTATGVLQFKYLLDRVQADYIGSFVVNAQQVADAPPGFTNSLKLQVTTAQPVLGPADGLGVFLPIEGTELQKFAFGTANAMPLTATIWTKRSRPGVYPLTLKNYAGTRTCPINYTVNAANTWERKVVTFPGDTSGAGAWLAGPTTAAYLEFAMALGSTPQAPASGWQAGNYDGVAGCTNGVAAVTDNFYITGVNLFPGTQAPSDAESSKLILPYSDALRRLRRWCLMLKQPALRGVVASSSVGAHLGMNLPDQLMKPPVLSMIGHLPVTDGGAVDTVATLGVNSSTIDVIDTNVNFTGTVLTPSRNVAVYPDGGLSALFVDARL